MFNIRLQAPNLASESLTFHIGNPMVWMNDHVTTKISEMDRKTNFLSYGAPLMHVELNYERGLSTELVY